MYVKFGEIQIDQSSLDAVYHLTTCQIHIDGKEIGEKGRKLHEKLRRFKVGDIEEFSCEDSSGHSYYGTAEVREINLDEKSIDDKIYYKFLIELQT